MDYHHGNGTQGIFWNDDSVFFASLHMHPDFDYPYCSGYEDETGPASGPGAGTTLNVPLSPGTNWMTYKAALTSTLERVQAFGAGQCAASAILCLCPFTTGVSLCSGALVVSLGLDTLGGDFEASDGAGMALNTYDFTEMGELFNSLPIPVLFIQEGGYWLEVSTGVHSITCCYSHYMSLCRMDAGRGRSRHVLVWPAKEEVGFACH